MDFPHLNDTQFPHLQNEDVYAIRNTFDYSRWSENTIVRLVNVLWDGSLNDAPLFDSDDERDAWFDAITDAYAIRLETAARIVPEGFVKLPLPYDVMARYNYLYVEIPIATGSEPIDYETDYGVRRWYFFIDRIDYRAPNSTHVYVTNDFWTTFQNDVEIKYMMLERGHAPMAASDVDSYLSNPIENSEYLLAPDVDFGRGSIVRGSDMIPFGNGKKYVVFASMATRENMLGMGQRTGTGANVWTPATFSDSAARDGHHMNINGYVWGDGYDYSSLRTRIDNNASNLDRLANNATCWCIPADQCFGFRGDTYYDSFLVKLARECPSFLQTIMAMFVVDESMISFNYDPVQICGFDLYYCRGTEQEPQSYELDRSMFAFPERYADFAKLYTYPYSMLELTDNDGQTVNVRIEDTGQISYQLITSVAFPFLDMRVLFRGIGGNGTVSYSWTNLTNGTRQIDIGADDWGSVKFDWPIPTFGLYMDGESAFHLRNWGNLKNQRIDAVTGYHTTMREANCAENNAVALANTAKSNEDANADTLVANTANGCNAQTANTALTVATNTANVTRSNSASSDITAYKNTTMYLHTSANNAVITATTVAQNATSIATTANSGEASIRTGAFSGMASAAMGAAALSAVSPALGLAAVGVGGATGAYVSSIEAQVNNENAVLMTQCESTVADATKGANNTNTNLSQNENTHDTNEMNDCKLDQNDNTNNCLTRQTANLVSAQTANAANSSATTKNNASRTRNTSVSNAGYTQIAAERSAKEVLEAAQRKARNLYEQARNAAPMRVGEVSGEPMADYFMTRGVQVKVRTESDSAIAQAGDHFARYGYAFERMWDVSESGLCPMPKFCYWKASDVWVDDRLTSTSDASRAIRRMFLDGVTLWKNPDEIGRVSVYDNRG